MDLDATTWIIVAIATLAGAALTVVPIVPGALLVPLGAIALGFVNGWGDLPVWLWVAQVVLVAGYVLVDNVAPAVGVSRAGGSRQAMLGGVVGVIAGPILLAFVIGPFALLVGPPIGAVAGTIAGEEYARRRTPAEDAVAITGDRDHVRLGIGAFVAWAVSLVVKLVVVGIQALVLVLAIA